MPDAEEVGAEDEEAIVLERDGARRGGRIEQAHRKGDEPGLEPVASHHQRRAISGAAPPRHPR